MQLKILASVAAGALTLAGCSTILPNNSNVGGSRHLSASRTSTSRYCANCGIVTRIDPISSNRTAPTNTGAVLGGIVGAVAGHQITQESATSKSNNPAASGGVQIRDSTYKITIHMDDGRSIVVNQPDLAGVRENTSVRVINGRVVIR